MHAPVHARKCQIIACQLADDQIRKGKPLEGSFVSALMFPLPNSHADGAFAYG